MADPSCEPTVGKLPYGLWNIVVVLIWLFLFCVVLSQEQIDGYVVQLFDKDPPTTQPTDLPLPFSSENPPPLVRAAVNLVHSSNHN
jgi:hypothetical protein